MATTRQPKGSEPPRWLIALMTSILRTPLHGIFSKSIMVLSFAGRRSGTVYSTPVSYLRTGDVVTAFTDSPWQRNLQGAAPVRVWLGGKEWSGHAEIVDDQAAVAAGLSDFLTRVPRDARFYGVRIDAHGRPNPEQVSTAAQQHVLIRIALSTTRSAGT